MHDLTARLELRGVDWTETRAFALPTDQHGYVRLNIRGREREGIVEPDDADELMDEIAEGLLTFRDPDGGPAVEAVDRVADVLGDGPGLHQMPDLVVRWANRPATRLAGVGSPKFGDVARRGGGSGRSGNHTCRRLGAHPARRVKPSSDKPPAGHRRHRRNGVLAPGCGPGRPRRRAAARAALAPLPSRGWPGSPDASRPSIEHAVAAMSTTCGALSGARSRERPGTSSAHAASSWFPDRPEPGPAPLDHAEAQAT